MTASSRIEAVAFDLDGLLVNTEELYQPVGTELLRRRGHSFEPDLLDAMMGRLTAHSMFAGGGAIRRLQMCADCRVVDMMESTDEPSILNVPKAP